MEPDQLDAAPQPWSRRWVIGSVVLVLAAVTVLAVQLAGPSHGRASRPAPSHPPPRPASLAPPSPDINAGSIFLEHLGRCTSTDHRHRLTVALGVANLASRSLQFIGAEPLVADAAVRLVNVRVGPSGCGAGGSAATLRLAPAADVVVGLTFRIGRICPDDTSMAVRVSFDTGGAGIVHADSSQLANLSRLGFVQCGSG